MKKRLLAVLLSVLLLVSMFPMVAGAASIPTAWKAPGSLAAGVTDQYEFETSIYFSVDSQLQKFIDPEQADYDALGIDSVGHTAQIDWKLNNGAWHYTKDWDTLGTEYAVDSGIYYNTGYLDGDTTQEVEIFDLRNGDGGVTPLQKMLGSAMIKGSDANGEGNRLDLANNTFYFRVRVLVNYNVTDSGDDKFILSPWSEVLSYGKSGASLVKPVKLETPTISNPVVGKYNDGAPKISFTAITPKQVQDANNYIKSKDSSDIEAEHQMNINNSGWIEAHAGSWWLSSETRTIDVPTTYDNGKIMKIDEAYIQIRMRYLYAGSKNVPALKSEWSNVISVNTPGWSKASNWAATELESAVDAGLIPDCLKGADLTKKITRAEFAAISAKLYEKLSGKKLTPAAKNPFVDTKDKEVLKAYGAGIAVGITSAKFQPNTLVTREEAATMLVRVLKKVKIPGWTYAMDAKYKLDFKMPPTLADDAKIGKWAKESVYFMIAYGIITGTNDNAFKPQQTASGKDAAAYTSATREQALVLSLRMIEKTGDKKITYKKAG